MTASPRPDVVVVGSVNRDYVCRVQRLPAPGQTVLGGEMTIGSGGKGGNQAVAAALLGARTAMVARVGTDIDGQALVADLETMGVDTTHVVAVDGVRTGSAFVLVDSDGENAIAVASGANARLTPDETTAAVRQLISRAALLVTQAEVPIPSMVAAITAATEAGARAVVNLAPFHPLPVDVLARCDPLIVNESEASELLETEVHDVSTARLGIVQLAQRARSAVITLGAAGAVVASGRDVAHVPGHRVAAVDSTGAGDAFTGAVAAALSRGGDLWDAAAVGVQAGAFAVARAGARTSYPRVADLDWTSALTARPRSP
jgi:ribokinase